MHLLSPIVAEPVSYIIMINIRTEIPSYKNEIVTAVINRKISQTQGMYEDPILIKLESMLNCVRPQTYALFIMQ